MRRSLRNYSAVPHRFSVGSLTLLSLMACADGGAPPQRRGASNGGSAADTGGWAGMAPGASGSASAVAGSSGSAAGSPWGEGGSSGAGGAQGSGGMQSPVVLPEGVVGLFPLPGASNVCADPALRLSFASAPTLGDGKLEVFADALPGNPVAVVDFFAGNVTKEIGGQTFNLASQVYVEGNDVVVPLDSEALDYGKQYHVRVGQGAISTDGVPFSITAPAAWTFSTWSVAPSGSQLSVALDGSGQFCSWQGALDAVPANNTAPVIITIKNGTYHGVVYFSGKHAITLRGEDRKRTIFSGVNNENLNGGTKLRALIGADDAGGLVIENLTIQNLTPQGGSQAEALRLQDCDQCVVRKADILSLQDTLLWSGRLYAEDCYIAGNVDFIWGEGAAYFNRCEIKTVGRNGYVVQSRSGAGAYGYVFVDSRITSDPGITGSVLARIDVQNYPNSHVAYVNCTLGTHIASAGWTITGGSAPASLRFWEYQSLNEAGALVDVNGRVAGVQISAQQAAQMRDPQMVLGGWQPPQ